MKSEQEIASNSKPATASNLIYRLSIGTLIAAGILVILGLVSYVQNNAQQASLDEQSRKTNELVQQVKELSEQNKKLSQTSVNYAYCNSVILARYTQDRKPISVDDLNKCIISSFPEGQGAPTLEQTLSNMSSDANSSANTEDNVKANSNSVQSTSPVATNQTIPTEPKSPQSPTPSDNKPTNNLLTLTPSTVLPGVKLNTPCLKVSNLLDTCRPF